MQHNMPIFIGFYHRIDSADAPYRKLAMPATPQIKTRQQFLELRAADAHALPAHRARKEEAIAAFQALAPQTQPVALPVHDLDPIAEASFIVRPFL